MPDSNNVFVKRRDTLHSSFQSCANVTTRVVAKNFGQVPPIYFVGGEIFDHMNFYYWGLVSWFKQANDFPRTHLINGRKRAALTIYAAMAYKDLIFEIDPLWKQTRFGYFFDINLSVEIIQLFVGRVEYPAGEVAASSGLPPDFVFSERDEEDLLKMLSATPSVDDPAGPIRSVDASLVYALCIFLERMSRHEAADPHRLQPDSARVETPLSEDFDFRNSIPTVKPYVTPRGAGAPTRAD